MLNLGEKHISVAVAQKHQRDSERNEWWQVDSRYRLLVTTQIIVVF